jgi:hypothetical protein
MPVEVTCFPGPNRTVTITVDPKKDRAAVPSASLDDLTIVNESTAWVNVRNDGTKRLDDLFVALCIEGLNGTCINKTAGSLGSGEFAVLKFTGFLLPQGGKVSVLLSSGDFQKVSEEAIQLDLQPQPASLGNASGPATTPPPKSDDQQLLVAALLVLILVLLAAIVAVTVKK